MSDAAVAGLMLLIDDTLGVLRNLSEENWDAESGCPGWSVKDLVNHLAATFTVVIDPVNALDGVTAEVSLEAINNVMVDSGSDMEPADVLASYTAQKDEAIAAVAALQAPEHRGATAVLGDVGEYELHWFANALCFDHLCHLHVDLLGPRGPVKLPAPPIDEARLSPTLDWLIEVIPQWSGAELAKVLTAPVDVVLSGITTKRFQLVPNGTERVGIEIGVSGAGASISGDGLEAVSWLTGRSDKVLATSVDGDTALAVAALAAMRAV